MDFLFTSELVDVLLDWYDLNKRDLPWRHTKDPYAVWISEIMLQQTQVETVKGYYERFLKTFPTVFDLASASLELVYKLWEGLGYYSRARNLHKTANKIVSDYKGNFPSSAKELISLGGIGKYTSGAIASIAFGEQVPAVDGNVLRVFTRFFGYFENITDQRTKSSVYDCLFSCIPKRSGDFNQSLIELGACVCRAKNPCCSSCPLNAKCFAFFNDKINELPVKSKIKTRTILKKTVLILKYDGKVLLHRRSADGLLGGLYEPIVLDGELSVEDVIAHLGRYTLNSESIRVLKPARHVFTHLEWHMSAYYAELDECPNLVDGYFMASPYEVEHDFPIPSAFAAYNPFLR